uniref:Putative secreted protein n=1 Tax=Ixodes ricinus TaxID=34613 RepID=A0A6B0UZK4_IXORI
MPASLSLLLRLLLHSPWGLPAAPASPVSMESQHSDRRCTLARDSRLRSRTLRLRFPHNDDGSRRPGPAGAARPFSRDSWGMLGGSTAMRLSLRLRRCGRGRKFSLTESDSAAATLLCRWRQAHRRCSSSSESLGCAWPRSARGLPSRVRPPSRLDSESSPEMALHLAVAPRLGSEDSSRAAVRS